MIPLDDDLKDLLVTAINNPEVVPELLQVLLGKYRPIVREISNEFLNVYEEYVNDYRRYELSARDKWNEYQAYLGSGFNEDQAMKLLTRTVRL